MKFAGLLGGLGVKEMAKLGEPFEIDPPEPDWLEPPRQCGHEWRNNDFTCMDCVEGRITVMERELSLARSALVRIAELDGDCENQKFNLTRFQAAQVARRFLASSATGRVAIPSTVHKATRQSSAAQSQPDRAIGRQGLPIQSL